jgi:type I restriction enzyme S subunit
MSEWKECSADEYCTKVADGTHDTPRPIELGEYLITSKHITGGTVDLSSAYRISKEDFEKINIRSRVDKWDVLVSMIGTVGEIVLVDHEPSYAIKNIGLFKCGDEIKARWLKYYLQSPIGKEEIQSRMCGTTQEYISLGELRKLPIKFPPLPEQLAIVGVLSSLDDKIELLRRQNKTLEFMAGALWRKMFVEDADPNWKIGKLGDCISVKGGTTPSTTNPEFWNGTISWTAPRDLSGSNKVFLHETERKITAKGLSQIGSGLLPIGTVLLSSRAPIGYLTISNVPVAINQGYIAVICDCLFSNYYMFFWIKSNMDLIIGAANGSTFLEISKSVFKSLEITISDKNDLNKFNSIVKPIFDKILSNEIQISRLSRLRDSLLPKLISGEVRVRS